MIRELKAQIDSIEREIDTLCAQRTILQVQWQAAVRAKLGDYVGKCNRCNKKYAKIVSAPLWKADTGGLRCGQKEFPAIILTTELIPFRLSTLPVDSFEKGWTEISSEEFDLAFERRVDLLRQGMKSGLNLDEHNAKDINFWEIPMIEICEGSPEEEPNDICNV